MKMNQTIVLAALVAGGLFVSSLALQAQNPPQTPPSGAQAGSSQGDHPDFVKILNLTEDQKPKFKAIMQSAMEKQKAVYTDSSLSKEDKKAKMKAIHEDTTSKMKALLTADQFAKWTSMRPHPRAGGPGGGTPPKQ